MDIVVPSREDLKEYGGNRVANWLLSGSMKMPWIYACVYLLLIRYCSHFIEKRGPLNIKKLVIAYDLLMVFWNAYIVRELVSVASEEKFFFVCNPMDFANHPKADRLFHSLWLFHISKLVECLDTVFFILSGKSRLVTWLHVYHHSSIIPYSRYMAEYVPDGHVFNFAALNSAIHVVMYGYYAVAALGPAWRRFLWWKRYLTLLQMAQFVYGITIALASAQLGCAYRPSTYYVSAAYISSILACFMNHYYQTYRAGNAKRHGGKPEPSKTE